MTKEDLTKIMELDRKRESIQYLFPNAEVSSYCINYLYRNKYERKYKEEFENITINYHDGE